MRRTIARSLGAMCGSIGAALTVTNRETSVGAKREAVAVTEAGDALRQAREFISEASGPPESEEEQERLTRTLYALDDASRLAEIAGEKEEVGSGSGGSEDVRAATLCADAMRDTILIADEVDALPAANGASIEQTMIQLEHCAKALRELQRVHRKSTLGSVAGGAVSADEAIARVEIVRHLEALARQAWLSAAHLVDSRP